MGWTGKKLRERMPFGGQVHQRRGPRRKIVQVLRFSDSTFGPDFVLLECGHKIRAWGQFNARCDKCLKEAQG